MSSVLWMLATLAAIEVVGDAEKIPTKGAELYRVDGDAGLSFKVDGPGAFLLDVRADGNKAESLEVVIVRDGRFASSNKLVAKPNRKGAPKGYALLAKVGFELASGQHTLTITVPGKKVAVALSKTKRLPKNVRAAAEVELGPAEPGPEDLALVAPTPASTAGAASSAPAPAEPKGEQPAPVTEVAASSVVPLPSDPAIAAIASMAPAAPTDTSARGSKQAVRIAVYDFELSDIDPNIGAVVTDSMLAEVRKLQGVSAIGMDEIRDMLSHEANKQILGCEDNESCLAEIAGALGVDELVSGKLAKVDEGVVFLVRRIDQNRATVLGVVNQRLKGEGGQEFLAAIGPAVEQLFSDRPLRPGLTRGVPKEMALRLDPPPLPTWTFWSVTGGAVAAGVVGGIFGVLAKDKEAAYRAEVEGAKVTPIHGRDLNAIGRDAQRRADVANYAFIGAGVMALSAGVVALFTDWYGYGEAK